MFGIAASTLDAPSFISFQSRVNMPLMMSARPPAISAIIRKTLPMKSTEFFTTVVITFHTPLINTLSLYNSTM